MLQAHADIDLDIRTDGRFKMKLCSRCREIRPFSEFHRDGNRGHQRYCKSCRRAYDHDYYLGAHARHRDGRKESQARRDQWLRELKANKSCTDCGQIYPPHVMQWDHLPGFVKLGEISGKLRRLDRTLLLEELGKCELVCANCHAIRTHERLRRRI
jgi:hypothetical protein